MSAVIENHSVPILTLKIFHRILRDKIFHVANISSTKGENIYFITYIVGSGVLVLLFALKFLW